MKFLSLLALLPFLALTYQAPASAQPVASSVEDAASLPWNEFTRDAAVPEAATKLLATFHIGARIGTFNMNLNSCAKDIQSVKLIVKDAPVTVQSFGVRFSDGTSREFAVNKTFNAGSDSGWIDIGLFRSMDSRCAVAAYAKANSSGNATVLVYVNTR